MFKTAKFLALTLAAFVFGGFLAYKQDTSAFLTTALHEAGEFLNGLTPESWESKIAMQAEEDEIERMKKLLGEARKETVRKATEIDLVLQSDTVPENLKNLTMVELMADPSPLNMAKLEASGEALEIVGVVEGAVNQLRHDIRRNKELSSKLTSLEMNACSAASRNHDAVERILQDFDREVPEDEAKAWQVLAELVAEDNISPSTDSGLDQLLRKHGLTRD